MSTKKETTDAEVLGNLQKLHVKLEANAADLAHLEVPRGQLGTLLARVDELRQQQGAMKVGKQEASKEFRSLVIAGQRLASGLRAMVKIHYGPSSEKLSEFDLQPFRGRKAKAPVPVAEPETPATPALTAQSPAPSPPNAAKV